eukprot:2096517-Prymnesium_polylepis.1
MDRAGLEAGGQCNARVDTQGPATTITSSVMVHFAPKAASRLKKVQRCSGCSRVVPSEHTTVAP